MIDIAMRRLIATDCDDEGIHCLLHSALLSPEAA